MTQAVAQDLPEQYEDTLKGRFLTFAMGNEVYGIDIRYITEIIGIQPITEVPEFPEYLKGIINLRGKIISVADARLCFRKPFREYNDRTCIVVIDTDTATYGLVVDSVAEVLVIQDDEIVPPPEVSAGGNKFIKGIGKVGNDIKLLLDCEKLFHCNDLERFTNAG